MVRFKPFQRVLGLLALVFCGLLGQHAAMAAGKAAAAPEGAPSGSPLRFAVEVEPENSNQNKSWPTIGYSTALTKQLGQPVKVVNSVLLREVARGSWAGEFDAMWVPANLAVGMLNKGFEIVGCDGQMVRMALLSAPSIKGFNDLNGKTLFLPQEDSLAAYVAIALHRRRMSVLGGPGRGSGPVVHFWTHHRQHRAHCAARIWSRWRRR